MENKWSFKEEAHAFKEDSYSFQSRSPSVSPGVALGVSKVRGSRVEVHGGRYLESCALGGRPHDFVVRCVSGPGAGALRRDGAASIVRQPAQTTRHVGAMAGGSSVRSSSQTIRLATLASRDRLSSDSVSRRAETASQRVVSQPTQVGDDEIPRLCHSLRRRSGSPVHAGCDLRSRERIDGCRAESAAGANRGAQDRHRSIAAGQGIFRISRNGVSADAEDSLCDPRRTAWTQVEEARPDEEDEETASSRRIACVPKQTRWTVSIHMGRQESVGDVPRRRRLQELQALQDGTSSFQEIAVRRVGCGRLARGNSRTVPQAIWNRSQLSSVGAGSHPNLYHRPGTQTVLRAGGFGAEKRVDLAALHILCRTRWTRTDSAFGVFALPPHVELDRAGRGEGIARWLRLLYRTRLESMLYQSFVPN